MKRWIALLAAIVIQSCLGVVYAWSTFVPWLKSEYGIHEGRTGLIFGICIACFTVSMTFGGVLQKSWGPRKTGSAGGFLFAFGYLLGAFSGGLFPLLVAGFGVIAGAGIGLGYVSALSTVIRLFKSNKGLVTGLTVAGFGLGSIFFAKAGLYRLEQGIPVLTVLRDIGIFCGITVLAACRFLYQPEDDAPDLMPDTAEFPLAAILKSTPFRLLFFLIFCGTFGGLLIIGNLKPIGLQIGLSAAQATLCIMLFAAGNTAGRLLWGIWYDRKGAGIIPGCLLLLAAGAGMTGLARGPVLFYPATLVTAFSFGGFFVLFAARTADLFGTRRTGEIYPFVFLGYGIAGLVGPAAGGWLLHYSQTTLLPAIAVILVALVGALAARFSSAAK